MTLSEASSLAQIIIAILTLIGIIVSLYMSIKALREVKNDRELRQAPFLAFKADGYRIPISFVKAGKRIPGFNPMYVEILFNDIPDNVESIRVKHKEDSNGGLNLIKYGHLINHGLGPALKTVIFWKPVKIKIGDEMFKIDDEKLQEPKYRSELNRLYPLTRNIKPNQETHLIWLPVFIEKDYEKKIKEAWGVLEINCFDVFQNKYSWKQSFYIGTGYDEERPYVHITFGDKEF